MLFEARGAFLVYSTYFFVLFYRMLVNVLVCIFSFTFQSDWICKLGTGADTYWEF